MSGQVELIYNTFCLWKHHVNLLLQSFRSVYSFAVINLRSLSTKRRYYVFYRHAIIQRTYYRTDLLTIQKKPSEIFGQSVSENLPLRSLSGG